MSELLRPAATWDGGQRLSESITTQREVSHER